MDREGYSKLYGAYYYRHECGLEYKRDENWLGFFDVIASRIITDIQPQTVLDVGCAFGFLVELLRKQGVEAYGMDISEYAIQHVHPDVQPYCWVGSVSQPFTRDYDLMVCIEVLEHVPPLEGEKAIENLCSHTQDILFSSTPLDYEGVTHFNVHPPEFWAEAFARHGFYRDVDFDASFISPWAVRFRKRAEPFHRMIRDYERRFWLLWKENLDLRKAAMKMRNELAAITEAQGHHE